MRKIVFLDFDGVLHGERDQEFARRALFERYVRKMPEVEIIISSSWREQYALDELKGFFHASIRERITGMTPVIENGYDPGGRQQEIETFLQDAGLNEQNACWIALDDLPHFFRPGCAYLTLVDPERGFTHEQGRALLDWYAESRNRP